MPEYPQHFLNKTALAKALEISRPTLDGYLAKAGSPAANSAGLFEFGEVAEYLIEHAPLVGEEISKRMDVEASRRIRALLELYAAERVVADELGPQLAGRVSAAFAKAWRAYLKGRPLC